MFTDSTLKIYKRKKERREEKKEERKKFCKLIESDKVKHVRHALCLDLDPRREHSGS
jgi:hypothetical protein